MCVGFSAENWEKGKRGFLVKSKKASTARGWHIFYVTLLFRYWVRSQSKPNLRSISRANTDETTSQLSFALQVSPSPPTYPPQAAPIVKVYIYIYISFSLYTILCISRMSVCAVSGKSFPSTWWKEGSLYDTRGFSWSTISSKKMVSFFFFFFFHLKFYTNKKEKKINAIENYGSDFKYN